MIVIADQSEAVERRLDPKSGIAYSLDEFVEFYGGTTEWHQAVVGRIYTHTYVLINNNQ
jgi:hypothetical protein